MKLFTEVHLPKFPFSITHKDKIFFIGSCFASEIGNQFHYCGFQILQNPLGTVYNPKSIFKQLQDIENQKFDTSLLYQQNEAWYYLNGNTQFSSTEKYKLEKKISSQLQLTHEFLQNASMCFITLGTSQVFEFNQNGKVVANCHKLPSNLFQRKPLSTKEIIECLQSTIQLFRKMNDELQIVFTISPIRHQRDGMINNSRSKARLISALEVVLETDNCSYFPSYEIVLDELRDYRFYEKDLIHLNETGIEYVWDKVSYCFFDERSKKINKDCKKYRKLTEHRVSGGVEYEKIHKNLVSDARSKLISQYPELNNIL